MKFHRRARSVVVLPGHLVGIPQRHGGEDAGEPVLDGLVLGCFVPPCVVPSQAS